MATDDAGFGPMVDDADHGSDEVFDACAHCGRPFETGVRYPVTTKRGPDGTLIVRSFCDCACQRAWDAEH